jgi:hypothetical protein
MCACKTFEVVAQCGAVFTVTIDCHPYVELNSISTYSRYMIIRDLLIDGHQVPRAYINPVCTEVKNTLLNRECKLAIYIRESAREFLCTIRDDVPKDCNNLVLLCSDEMIRYYNEVFIPAADEIEKQMRNDMNDGIVW